MTTPKIYFMSKRVQFYEPEPKKVSPCIYCFTGCIKYVGQVVAVLDKPPIGPGKVPDYWLNVAGETGAIKRVSVVLNFVKFLND